MSVRLSLGVGEVVLGVAHGVTKVCDVPTWLLFLWLGITVVFVGVDCESCGRFLLPGQGRSICVYVGGS